MHVNRRGGGCSGLQVTGMTEKLFLGVKISILGLVWVEKFGKYFFGVA